jgi:hypothetical protein
MMREDASLSMAQDLMVQFARLTGLFGEGTPRRYLWTDAFAVCNFLELHQQTGEEEYEDLALHLVDQVHHTLGRHREDDPRTGWISGLRDEEGERHPTKGGLRIGKELPERGLDEPFDQRVEWERDGQYYHYLTKWMHTLNRVGEATGDSTYNRWAIELAKTAHEAFTYGPAPGAQKRIVWKMSIDLSYPLVPSMGQHDPLDGLVTYQELQAAAPKRSGWPDLDAEIDDMRGICEGRRWATDDALGIGGLLTDAYRWAQLTTQANLEQSVLLKDLLGASLRSLQRYAEKNALDQPISFRLAFRELGLTIGLKAVERLQRTLDEHPGDISSLDALHARVEELIAYVSLGEAIEAFWLEDAHREAESWAAHRDINMVMLVTSLISEGYLSI